ncbi:MAG: DUF924 domain-containing protein [Gammaproteobacteria bacterium]|nr:MAG: DUF924 domain-containing protein [Gammaproteobacteria bacterium]
MSPKPENVLAFWFDEIEPRQWWQVDPAFDALIRSRFGALLDQAIAGELDAWRGFAHGRLAEIIVLDQFSRNIHRGTPQAFAQDAQALTLSQVAVHAGALEHLHETERGFLLMPFMHSESRGIHAQAGVLFKAHASANTFDFELKHKAIIDRFGRYPHRNAILGRASTNEEIEFLKQPGSGF